VTPETIIARTDSAIAGYGQSVTLQRTTVDSASGEVTIGETLVCPAMVRASGPQDLQAGEVLSIRIVISPTGLGAWGIPSRDDRIVIDGDESNLEQVVPIYWEGRLVRVNLLARG